MRPLVAHCYLGLGRLYHQTGRGEEARAELSAAIALYRAMDMTCWLPQAEAALAAIRPRGHVAHLPALALARAREGRMALYSSRTGSHHGCSLTALTKARRHFNVFIPWSM
jgi:hypothetical protein